MPAGPEPTRACTIGLNFACQDKRPQKTFFKTIFFKEPLYKNMTELKTKVAAIQIRSTENVDRNLDRTFAMCRAAILEGAQLLVVPEGFAYLGKEEGKVNIAECLPEGGPILKRCMEFAGKNRVELILGGFWEQSRHSAKVLNACIHIDRNGNTKSVYRKIHLFDIELPGGTVLKESATVEAGSQPIVTQTPFGNLGLSICYDIRFPELYRKLVDMGAIALAVPAAFTRTTGMDHWHVLLRARAIECQSYVIASAQSGHHYGSRFSYGHALICDPWGCILSECGEEEGFAIASIDPMVVSRIRRQMPALQHRRFRIDSIPTDA